MRRCWRARHITAFSSTASTTSTSSSPVLESSEIVWPAVYELLRTRGLAVVTTHTHFDISEYGSIMQDLQASRRRVAPLLHALVQSSDYVVKLHPIASIRHEDGSFAEAVREHYELDSPGSRPPVNDSQRPAEPARYFIEVPGSLTQTHAEPPVDWGWDRDRGTAYQVKRASGLTLPTGGTNLPRIQRGRSRQ